MSLPLSLWLKFILVGKPESRFRHSGRRCFSAGDPSGSSPDNLLAGGVNRIQALSCQFFGSTSPIQALSPEEPDWVSFRGGGPGIQKQPPPHPKRTSFRTQVLQRRRSVGVLAGQLVGRWGESNPGLAGIADPRLRPMRGRSRRSLHRHPPRALPTPSGFRARLRRPGMT